MSRLRFRRDAGEATGFMPEWRVANRSFTVPPEFALGSAVKRVTDYFASPHMNLEFSEDAAQWHTSYQGGLNVQSHVAREKGDTMSGARMGAAPWQIGVLSGCLLVYEIFAGVYSAEQLEARSLRITADHLKRAFALMKIAGSSVVLHCRQIRVHAIKAISLGEEGEEPGPNQQVVPPPDDFSALEVPDQDFEQSEAEAPADEEQVDSDGRPDHEEDHDHGEASPAQQPPPEPAPLPPVQGLQPLNIDQVRSIDFGYGDRGLSVQPCLHAKHLTDRYIAKMTLLHGTPKITCKQACDGLRSSSDKGRKALPKTNWMAVMTSACKECPILQLSGDELHVARIPDDPGLRVQYHNHLMTLCGLTLRELVGSMTQAVEKAKQAAVKHDMKVVKHRVRGDNGIELRLSEIGGEGRSAWVSEGSVSKALREEYFNRAGQARQKQRKKVACNPCQLKPKTKAARQLYSFRTPRQKICKQSRAPHTKKTDLM
ncbi:unnamed protein product [Cladocopium goreaui]|uniref:Uncharacterized protein n=1 Tax=Cladocopium goreaui TaxID=2562237 RepID=A0A9P1DNU3_9DINO|nr:unnamed protein product [Cladocopium goreaui]